MVKAHRILGKSEIMEMDYMNFILEASASSARFGTITEYQPKGKFVTRANLNAMLVMPFGTGKSSSLFKISNKHAEFPNDLSFPGMIGSITKDGDFNPGSVVKTAGKVMVLDEFQKLTDGVKDAMNSLLEYPHRYQRNVGFHVRGKIRKSGKFYRVLVSRGQIDVFSKFSCIAGGMELAKDNSVRKAWNSRFMVVNIIPGREWHKKLTIGEKVLKINPGVQENDFLFPKYAEFWREYWKKLAENTFLDWYFRKNPQNLGYATRNLQDLARVSAFICSLSKGKIIKKRHFQNALKFQKIALFSIIKSGLTDVQFSILQNTDMENQQLADMTGTSVSNIIQRKEELKKLGLIN